MSPKGSRAELGSVLGVLDQRGDVLWMTGRGTAAIGDLVILQ